ncbi:MAG: hypothetical protein WC683_01775 [bacterium]
MSEKMSPIRCECIMSADEVDRMDEERASLRAEVERMKARVVELEDNLSITAGKASTTREKVERLTAALNHIVATWTDMDQKVVDRYAPSKGLAMLDSPCDDPDWNYAMGKKKAISIASVALAVEK